LRIIHCGIYVIGDGLFFVLLEPVSWIRSDNEKGLYMNVVINKLLYVIRLLHKDTRGKDAGHTN
jgi:hypothetical protein